jgi:hypothetical protein
MQRHGLDCVFVVIDQDWTVVRYSLFFYIVDDGRGFRLVLKDVWPIKWFDETRVGAVFLGAWGLVLGTEFEKLRWVDVLTSIVQDSDLSPMIAEI